MVCATAHGAYEWLRPLTATEVRNRVDAAKTWAEAKSYFTQRAQPCFESMFNDRNGPDPNDHFELTQEVDGAKPNTRLVGVRGTTFVQ